MYNFVTVTYIARIVRLFGFHIVNLANHRKFNIKSNWLLSFVAALFVKVALATATFIIKEKDRARTPLACIMFTAN